MTTAPKRGTELLYSLIAQARTYPDSIVLGRGDPDFDTPAHIIAAAREAMERHAGSYTPPEGLLALREAIAERVRRVNGVAFDPETEVVVTNGGQEALFLMVLASLAPGEALLVPEPNYNTYSDALRFARGEKVAVTTSVADNFRVKPDSVRAALTPTARALLLVSPNNPSANMIGEQDQRALVELAAEHDLLILADDIYDMFTYDGYRHASAAAQPGGRERTLTLNALSKSFAMTGWRTGWIVGPAMLMEQVRRLKAAVSGATSVIAQYGALAALTGPQQPMHEMHAAYTRRRRVVLDELDAMGIRYGVPQGGQFVFADISFTGLDSAELAKRVLSEAHVLVYPGASFSQELAQYLRITFLQPEDKLREGLSRMRSAMERILAERDGGGS